MVLRLSLQPPCLRQRVVGVAFAVLLVILSYQPPQADAAGPRPFICMYGHSDNAGVTDAFRKLVPRINVIEGTSRNATFIKELRRQKCIYAAHLAVDPTAVTDEFMPYLKEQLKRK